LELLSLLLLGVCAGVGIGAAQSGPAKVPVHLNWDCNCLVLGPRGIQELVRDAREAGVDGINMRLDNKGVLSFRTRAGACYNERLDAFGEDFDPLAVLVSECHKQGIAANLWVDLFEAAYDPLITAHPEFSPQGRPGKPPLGGMPCYAHPEVRSHLLDLVDEYVAYRPNAVFFCTKSNHVPRNRPNQPRNMDSGFNPPVVRRYRELYGVDILKEPFDRRKLGLIRGEFVIDFLVEARRRLNRAGIPVIVGATVSGRLQSTGPNMLLDWRRILQRRAADALLMANSRGEYHVFYNARGKAAFAEIRQACDKAGVQFWPYIISSGTYQPIAARVGFAGLLDYVPRQIDYLATMGGDAVLVHDLDLYTFDRNLRRALWKAAGRRSRGIARAAKPENVPVPDAVSIAGEQKNAIPCGGFEQNADAYWFLQSSWTMLPGTPLSNASFERHASDSRPAGWSSDCAGNPKLRAVYDWKVMHGDPFSGRTFSGRASLALGATASAGSGGRTAAWTAEIPAPAHLVGNQRIRVQVHGESLVGIDSVGMNVACLDGTNKLLTELHAEAPREGTFPWRPLEVAWPADARAKKLRVRLYLTVGDGPRTEGRVWFDDLTIEPAEPSAAESLTFPANDVGQPAYGGRRSARWAARPGWDLVGVPFLIERGKTAGSLRVALRAEQPTEVNVACQKVGTDGQAPGGDKGAETIATFDIGRQWRVFKMPAEPGSCRLVFRCRRPGVVWIDEAHCSKR